MPTQNPKEANPIVHDEILHMWETPEFVKHDKGKKWYLITSVALISLIVYAIYTSSATMAIVFILIGGMFFMTQRQEPKMQEIAITKLGIWIENKFYAYSNLRSFWIVYEPPYIRSLYFLTVRGRKTIQIQLNDQDPVLIRNLLVKEIPEEEGRHEEGVDTLIRLFRLH